jgi:hypothetical protein
MSKASLVFGLLALTSSACILYEQRAELDETYPGDEYVIWISQHFFGGRQCDVNDTYRPPDSAALLRAQGIAVFEFDVEYHPVCAACGCPAYSATHFALINLDDLGKAQALGFKAAERDAR